MSFSNSSSGDRKTPPRMTMSSARRYFTARFLRWRDVQPTLTAGLDTKKEINFAVYPNPSEGKITIAGNLNNSSAIITDMRGRIFKEVKNISTGQQIDLTDLQRGSYFITIETDGKPTTQKLILQ